MLRVIHKPLTVFLVSVFILFSTRIVFSSPAAQVNNPIKRTYKFTNGQWFDGKGFKRRVVYSVNGILTQKQPQIVDEVVDLKNGYVLPPFADAHCHHFDSPYIVAQQIEIYLRDGVFYAKVTNNFRSGAQKVAPQVNKPASIDVSYAHGGLTSNYSHPIDVYEALSLGFYSYEQQVANAGKIWESRKSENNAYYIIETADDLERKWPLILEGHPDFIKIFLRNSEVYEQRRLFVPTTWGRADGGVDPKLVPAIVEKAHRAGLRVTAAVSSAYDYHVAVTAEVDEISHPPCYQRADDNEPCALSSEDARLTDKRGIFVTLITSEYEKQRAQRVIENESHNLKLLKPIGVKFALGSDSYGKTPAIGAIALSKLGLFNNLELLRIWCENTPHTIFPNRKIGRLEQGYEASFLVLSGNPLIDFEQVRNITLRFKQGLFINLGSLKPQPAT